MKYIVSHYRWSGIRDVINQDSLLVHHVKLRKKEVLLVAVADGIGSLYHSEEASYYCLKTISNWFYETAKDMILSKEPLDSIELSLQSCIKNLQLQLAHFQKNNDLDFGTTLTSLLCVGNEYLVVHIGDSKGLFISYKSLLQKIASCFSKDRSCVSVEQKTFDNIDAFGRLTDCIGMAGTDKAFFLRGKLCKRTLWLIGTDGILMSENHAFVKKCFNNFFSLNKENLQLKLEALGRNAVFLGSKDNMAIVGVIVK